MIQAYSLKAKQKVEVKNPRVVKTKRGGYMIKGECPLTGAVVCLIISETRADELIESGEAKKDF